MSDVDTIFSELPAPVAAEVLAILDRHLGTTTQRDAQALGVTGHWLTVYVLGVLRSCERRCSALADDLQRSPAERSDARELWFFLGPLRERVAAEKDQQLAMARQAIEGLQALESMPSNADEFAEYLRQQAKEMPERVLEPWLRRVAFQLLTVTVQNTPVNTGRLRNGWHLTIGTASGADRAAAENVVSEGEGVINQWKLGETLWLQNNVPYARIIEDGLFAHDTPAEGSKATHVPKSRRSTVAGTILVRGGYSVSAPNGMLADAVDVVTAEIDAGRL